MMKYVVAIGLIAVLLAVGYYFTAKEDGENMMTNYSDSMQDSMKASAEKHVPPESMWAFTDAPARNGISQTAVTVNVRGEQTIIGTFAGHCADMLGSAWSPREGAAAGAICWSGSNGVELALFSEGEMYVIKTAVLDQGNEETGSVRGEMVTLLTL